MSVQTNGEAGQEPPAGTPGEGQEPTPNDGQQGDAGTEGQEPQGSGAPQKFDVSKIEDPDLRAVVEKIAKDAEEARREAARYRTERTTLQGKVTEYERQNETAEQAAARQAEETAARLEALAAENRSLKVDSVVRDAATKARAFNPATVRNLIDSRVELDEDGNPTNIDDLVKALKESDPYLFRKEPRGADGGSGSGQQQRPAGGSINDNIRNAARGLSARSR